MKITYLILLLGWSVTSLSAQVEAGVAKYYGEKFHGKKTANGEVFDQNAYTAAHAKLPFGSIVRVTRTDNGKSIVVRINDRCKSKKGFAIDLSKQAGAELGLLLDGNADVRLEVLEGAEKAKFADALKPAEKGKEKPVEAEAKLVGKREYVEEGKLFVGGYGVQFGNFNDKKNAETAADIVESFGHNTVLYHTKDSESKELYKLFVASYPSMKEALKARRTMEKTTKLNCFIVEMKDFK